MPFDSRRSTQPPEFESNIRKIINFLDTSTRNDKFKSDILELHTGLILHKHLFFGQVLYTIGICAPGREHIKVLP